MRITSKQGTEFFYENTFIGGQVYYTPDHRYLGYVYQPLSRESELWEARDYNGTVVGTRLPDSITGAQLLFELDLQERKVAA